MHHSHFLYFYTLLLLLLCSLPLQDDVVEDSMVVDIRHHRYFVCRRGQVLRELAEEYGGVAVSFPRTGANSQRVTLKGAKDCVEAAKKRIQEIIEDLVRGTPQIKKTFRDIYVVKNVFFLNDFVFNGRWNTFKNSL